MGIEESNWLIKKLSKGMESNPYTQEEKARMARERAVKRDANDPASQFIGERLKRAQQNWYHLREMFGWVPPTNKEFSQKLDLANKGLQAAYLSKYLGGVSQEAADKINQVRVPLADVSKNYKTIAGAVTKYDAAMKIIATCDALSVWANTPRNDPNEEKLAAEAAHHFDNLFGYLATFLADVSFASMYAPIFSQIATSGFFSGMREKLLTNAHRADKIIEEADAQFRPAR